MNEFEAIENIFLPLSFGATSALDFKDDVAFLENENLIISSDSLVENTHFRSEDPPYSIGQKLVRVNVSDIIAKGAIPFAAILNISWNNNRNIQELKEIANGIKDALIETANNMPIIGGDTTKINGPIVLSLTILGRPINKMVKRQNAGMGDLLCVTGNIGDAKIGLEALNTNSKSFPIAILHYQIPQIPKLQSAEIISKYANSSLDISDGLLGDIKKLLPNNQFSYSLDFEKIPFSNDGNEWLKIKKYNQKSIFELLTFGDDYQIAFSVKQAALQSLKKEFEEINQKLSVIGKITTDEKSSINIKGQIIILDNENLSYVHQL